MDTKILLGGLFLALPFLSPPQTEKKNAPSDLPPILCLATASKGPGKSVVVQVSVPRLAAKVKGKTIPKRGLPKVKVTVLRRELRVVLNPDSPSQLVGSGFFTLSGDPVEPGEILRRLKKDVPVLLSATGKMIDPYYLQVVKPETLLLVLGPRDGAPNLDLYPRVFAGKQGR